MRYEPLSLGTRKQIWASFLKKVVTANGATKYGPKDLDRLAKKDFNGRQVRAPSSPPSFSSAFPSCSPFPTTFSHEEIFWTG
jgi:hypothetical protein